MPRSILQQPSRTFLRQSQGAKTPKPASVDVPLSTYRVEIPTIPSVHVSMLPKPDVIEAATALVILRLGLKELPLSRFNSAILFHKHEKCFPHASHNITEHIIYWMIFNRIAGPVICEMAFPRILRKPRYIFSTQMRHTSKLRTRHIGRSSISTLSLR